MRYLLSLLLLLFTQSHLLYGQFDCTNLDLLGIYYNNRNTDQLSLLMTNSNREHDGNNMPYTTFYLINEAGDSILASGPVFSLPNSSEDTIVYNVKLHDNYRHIYDLPDYRCGELLTEDPGCVIDYCFDSIPEIELPKTQRKDCDDFEVVGVYETANGGLLDYSVIITNTNRDSARAWDLAYTNFQFLDRMGEAVSENSDPSFIVPMQYGDTIIVHLDFKRSILDGEVLLLEMTDPDCLIPYVTSTLVSNNSVSVPSYRLFPNPVNDIIYLKTTSPVDSWMLMELSGRRILSDSGNRIDMSSLSPGPYILRVKWEEAMTTEMIVKH